MSQAESRIMVKGDEDVIDAIRLRLEQILGHPVAISERSNLDGSAPTWVLAATIAVQAVPIILNFIKDYASAKRVKKIKVGDIEIENPDDALIEAMKKRLGNG